jgi:ABC-2 type transport system permease protein
VIGASVYIIVCSFKNRLRMRLQRLREPRYLIGALVGGAYLYFSVFGGFRRTRSAAARNAARRRTGTAPALSSLGLAASGPAVAGLALMIVSAVSWLAPFTSGLLDFSDAEVQFLFPAPVSRRKLLLHRMLRSQIGLLIGSLVVGLVIPAASGAARLRFGVAMWVLLATGKVYFTGVSLSRARMRAGTANSRRLAWLPVAILAAGIAIVATVLVRAWIATPPSGVRDLFKLVGDVSLQPLPRVVLWPFVTLTRPLFTLFEPIGVYLIALAVSVLVLAATIAWVLKIDEAFHDAAADAVEQRKRRTVGRQQTTYNVRSTGWTLGTSGRAEGAFAWKAATQTLRVVDNRSLMRIGLTLFALTIAARSVGREGPAATLGAFAMGAAVFTILMAPQILRIDIRQDLEHLELLKTWPVKAAAVVRGELLWPGVLLSGFAWTMIAIGMVLSGTVLPRVGAGWRFGIGAALAIVGPALVFAQLTVHNGLALMFPAWVPLGHQRARGLDAMGQRLIMLGGTWLLLIVMALPGAIAGGIVWFALGRFFGPVMLVPAALACAVVIAVEVLLATEMLGPAYERLDVMAVERAE